MDVKLVMFKQDGQRKDLSLETPTTVIGRGEECSLRIPLMSVSREHCEVNVDEDEVVVKDLASSNGTYVNNARVNEMSLNAGDRLVVGPVVFTVQIDGVPEEIAPTKQPTADESAAGEEIVDLEADLLDDGQDGSSMGGLRISTSAAADEQDMDPIAALEALAADTDEDEEEKK